MKQVSVVSATHLRVNVATVAKLVNPPAGLDYTPFFCCLIPLTVILDKRLYILL
jgi:hypothetical protein